MPSDKLDMEKFLEITDIISKGSFSNTEIQKLITANPNGYPEEKQTELIDELKKYTLKLIEDNF